MKTPQFLYVPRVNTISETKLIIDTRQNSYWQVLEFETENARSNWCAENETEWKNSANAIVFHKKYPFLLLNTSAKTEIKPDKLVKIGERASDWYAQFWLRNKKLSRPIFAPEDDNLRKAEKYFRHWVWGDNVLSDPENSYLINLEYGLSLKFPYGEAFFASFEDFETSLADVQFLSGHRPDAETVEKLIIDAWNFLGISERLDDGFGLEDINDDLFD